jgi:hypothetical protein
MTRDKWTPKAVMTLRGVSPVVRVEAFPPNKHPAKSCIRADCTLVLLTAVNGESRQYGFEKAWIDSHLRMRVSGYNPGFEEVAHWEDAKD